MNVLYVLISFSTNVEFNIARHGSFSFSSFAAFVEETLVAASTIPTDEQKDAIEAKRLKDIAEAQTNFDKYKVITDDYKRQLASLSERSEAYKAIHQKSRSTMGFFGAARRTLESLGVLETSKAEKKKPEGKKKP